MKQNITTLTKLLPNRPKNESPTNIKTKQNSHTSDDRSLPNKVLEDASANESDKGHTFVKKHFKSKKKKGKPNQDKKTKAMSSEGTKSSGTTVKPGLEIVTPAFSPIPIPSIPKPPANLQQPYPAYPFPLQSNPQTFQSYPQPFQSNIQPLQPNPQPYQPNPQSLPWQVPVQADPQAYYRQLNGQQYVPNINSQWQQQPSNYYPPVPYPSSNMYSPQQLYPSINPYIPPQTSTAKQPSKEKEEKATQPTVTSGKDSKENKVSNQPEPFKKKYFQMGVKTSTKLPSSDVRRTTSPMGNMHIVVYGQLLPVITLA